MMEWVQLLVPALVSGLVVAGAMRQSLKDLAANQRDLKTCIVKMSEKVDALAIEQAKYANHANEIQLLRGQLLDMTSRLAHLEATRSHPAASHR